MTSTPAALVIPPLLVDQMSLIHRRWPFATIVPVGDGSYVVTVPGVYLVKGWSHAATIVYFRVPVGFPCAAPIHFWTHTDLRFTHPEYGYHNCLPQCTRLDTPAWSGGRQLTHFLYRVSAWSANSDTLLTYLHVIRGRLAILR